MKKKQFGKLALCFALLLCFCVPFAPPARAEYQYELIVEDGVFVKCKGYSPNTSVTIPEGVTVIGEDAFYGAGVTNVVIPEGVTEIRDRAFKGNALRSVKLPSTLRSIGDFAFSGMPLETVDIPAGVTHIGDRAFESTTWLIEQDGFVIRNGILIYYGGSDENVAVPAGVTKIAGGALGARSESFRFGSSKRYPAFDPVSVTIPEGVTEIGANAFRNCGRLATINLPSSLTTIGENAFAGTPWLKAQGEFVTVSGTLIKYNGPGGAVTIPDGVVKIGAKAFGSLSGGPENSAVTSVTIPEGVTAIESEAFAHCEQLKSVSFPSTLRSIGDYAFFGCDALETVAIPEGVTDIGKEAFYSFKLKSLSIPGSVTAFGKPVFNGSVGTLRLAEGLRSIDGAFHCNVTDSVSLPDSLVYFGQEGLNVTGIGTEQERYAFYHACLDKGWTNPAECIDPPSSERAAALAAEITRGIPSDYEKAQAINNWVASNIRYDDDYFYRRKDTVTTAVDEVLDSRLTICDGYARLTCALLRSAGIPANYVTGLAYGSSRDVLGARSWDLHAWNEAFIDGRWIVIDPTFNSSFFYYTQLLSEDDGSASMTYFDMDLAEFAVSHIPQDRSPTKNAADIPSLWAISEMRGALSAALLPYELQSAYRRGITREEFCRLMVRLVERESGTGIDNCLAARGVLRQDSFTDTDNPDILAANALGIVNGRSETLFDPSGAINRQEAAAMLARTARLFGLKPAGGETFGDTQGLPDWAAESIAFVSGLSDPSTGSKVMGGTGGGNFSPLGGYTREQAALTALRLYHCAAQ